MCCIVPAVTADVFIRNMGTSKTAISLPSNCCLKLSENCQALGVWFRWWLIFFKRICFHYFFIYMHVYLCESMCTCKRRYLKSQKRVLEPLKLEWQMVVSYTTWLLETTLGSSVNSASAPNYQATLRPLWVPFTSKNFSHLLLAQNTYWRTQDELNGK